MRRGCLVPGACGVQATTRIVHSHEAHTRHPAPDSHQAPGTWHPAREGSTAPFQNRQVIPDVGARFDEIAMLDLQLAADLADLVVLADLDGQIRG
jgi:hypothetical protein